ncbi:MAG TPA: hypothetical protein GXX18_20045 [Bacillales bacterium]|nr:hypothetical protein [Bacillales bacterium]
MIIVIGLAMDSFAVCIGKGMCRQSGTILTATITIGLVTLFFAFLGMFIGVRFGRRLRFNIEMLGGIILIAIGVKILLQHLLNGA